MLPDARVDDLIVIFQAGAYGLTASPDCLPRTPGAGRGARLPRTGICHVRKETMTQQCSTIDDVKYVVVDTLGIEDRAHHASDCVDCSSSAVCPNWTHSPSLSS